MTVEELINALQQYDPKLRVVMRGYEGGMNDIDFLRPMQVALNVHDAWYYGKHEDADAWFVKESREPYTVENAVLIV